MVRRTHVAKSVQARPALAAREAGRKAGHVPFGGLDAPQEQSPIEVIADDTVLEGSTDDFPGIGREGQYTSQLQMDMNRNVKALAALEGLDDQSSLGKALGLSVAQLSARFTCRSPWTTGDITKVADAFGMQNWAYALLFPDTRKMVRIWAETSGK